MIKPNVLFTTKHYMNPDQAPGSERSAAKIVQSWIKKMAEHNPNQKIPIIQLESRDTITNEKYRELISSLRHFGYPIPVAIALHENCIMWTEDESGLPDSIEQAKTTLQYVDLTRLYRLPF